MYIKNYHFCLKNLLSKSDIYFWGILRDFLITRFSLKSLATIHYPAVYIIKVQFYKIKEKKLLFLTLSITIITNITDNLFYFKLFKKKNGFKDKL